MIDSRNRDLNDAPFHHQSPIREPFRLAPLAINIIIRETGQYRLINFFVKYSKKDQKKDLTNFLGHDRVYPQK
jgi:hypothetical protein